ncbi:MAG: hypothetical protein EB060_10900 [Proteobacteria bacterium]|nr:hypothetical protein [Pseudomonadota bacterium]
MARMRFQDIDPVMQEDIEFAVRYGYPIEIEMLIRRECNSRSHAIRKQQGDDSEIKALRSRLLAYSQYVGRKYPRYANDRCPECGVKLVVRRCLACDLRKRK